MRWEVLVVLEGRRRRMMERMKVSRGHLRPWQQWWWRVVSHGVGWHVTVYITSELRDGVMSRVEI